MPSASVWPQTARSWPVQPGARGPDKFDNISCIATQCLEQTNFSVFAPAFHKLIKFKGKTRSPS